MDVIQSHPGALFGMNIFTCPLRSCFQAAILWLPSGEYALVELSRVAKRYPVMMDAATRGRGLRANRVTVFQISSVDNFCSFYIRRVPIQFVRDERVERLK